MAFAAGLLGCARGAQIECGPAPISASNHAAPAAADSSQHRWTFDGPIGSAPTEFDLLATGGPSGRWVIRERPDAPSARAALAQEDSSRSSSRFALAVPAGVIFGDVGVSVKCFPFAGRVDRACGLVWRLRDEQNYYLARANALEGNVRFYYVQNGSRHEVAGWDGPVTSCAWHTLRADMHGDHVEVFWDGQKVIDSRDGRFAGDGRIGLWTKADSRTLFDDLVVRRLP
jgi:hypothetical protein